MNQFIFRLLLFPLFVLCLKTAAAQPTDSSAERLVEKADFFINNGMLDSAIEYGHTLMDYARQNNLPLYESSAWSLLGIVAYHQGNMDEAIAQQDSALSIRQRYYGAIHPQVASSLSNIGAMILDLKGDPEAALKRYIEALDICNNCKVGKDTCTNNFFAALFNNIGNAQMDRNNFEEAEKEYMKAYAIRSQFPNDPKYKLAHLLNNIGTLKLETGHTSSARDYLLSAQSLYLQWNKGEVTPDLIQVFMNLGAVENLEYNREAAQQYFFRALELGDKFYEGQYLEFGKINYNLGVMFSEINALSEAEKHYHAAYDFWETNFGFHPDQTTALLGLATLAAKRGEGEEALRLFQKAEMLDEANFPEKHIRRANTYNQIGGYYSKKGDRTAARAYFLKQLTALGMEEVRLGAIAQSLPSNLLLAGLTNLGHTHFQDYKDTKDDSQLDAALRVFAIADSVVSKLRETKLSFNEQNELLRDARALAEWAMLAELAKYGPTSERVFNRSEQGSVILGVIWYFCVKLYEMVLDVKCCHKCGSEHIVKNGSNASGNPKYKCKACGFGGVFQTLRKSEEFKEMVVRAAQERSSSRGLARTFGISHQTALRWIKKKRSPFPTS
ncbi:MAG: tetratricopeptide repeat protein [Saprospiraceae bacterium]|nr:tetratricopeptide repeat protein [Saprospiraceae bacterium]